MRLPVRPLPHLHRRHWLGLMWLGPAQQVGHGQPGRPRTDDGGRTWKPINRGLRSEMMPNPTAEVGHCVHRIARHP